MTNWNILLENWIPWKESSWNYRIGKYNYENEETINGFEHGLNIVQEWLHKLKDRIIENIHTQT